MNCSKAKDADVLPPIKDDNADAVYFNRRTWAFFECVGYVIKAK